MLGAKAFLHTLLAFAAFEEDTDLHLFPPLLVVVWTKTV
jgi:hypothetical protein